MLSGAQICLTSFEGQSHSLFWDSDLSGRGLGGRGTSDSGGRAASVSMMADWCVEVGLGGGGWCLCGGWLSIVTFHQVFQDVEGRSETIVL